MLVDAVRPDVLESILNLIVSIKFEIGPVDIDGISEHVTDLLSKATRYTPYRQGYWLARRLRKMGGISDSSKITNIEDSLRSYGVTIRESDFGRYAHSIDALAVWRDKCSPLIWLNTSGDHVRDNPARRATLAHELCHILVDRRGALPFLEVLGGSVAELPERRANAFAAEFLCPQSYILSQFRVTPDPDELVDELSDKYEVGKQLAANQVRNWFSRMKVNSIITKEVDQSSFESRIARIALGRQL